MEITRELAWSIVENRINRLRKELNEDKETDELATQFIEENLPKEVAEFKEKFGDYLRGRALVDFIGIIEEKPHLTELGIPTMVSFELTRDVPISSKPIQLTDKDSEFVDKINAAIKRREDREEQIRLAIDNKSNFTEMLHACQTRERAIEFAPDFTDSINEVMDKL